MDSVNTVLTMITMMYIYMPESVKTWLLVEVCFLHVDLFLSKFRQERIFRCRVYFLNGGRSGRAHLGKVVCWDQVW